MMGFSLEICPAVLCMLNIGEWSSKESAGIEVILENLLVRFIHFTQCYTFPFQCLNEPVNQYKQIIFRSYSRLLSEFTFYFIFLLELVVLKGSHITYGI